MKKYFAKITVDKAVVDAKSTDFEANGKSPKENQYLGTYKDAWFGYVDLKKEGEKVRFYSRTSSRLKGTLLPFSTEAFIVKFDDRSYDADVFITFSFDEKGNATSAKLKPISDVTDFSFDFEDLDLQRVK